MTDDKAKAIALMRKKSIENLTVMVEEARLRMELMQLRADSTEHQVRLAKAQKDLKKAEGPKAPVKAKAK